MPEPEDFPVRIDRRRVLQGSASAALLLAAHPAAASIQQPAKPAPLSAVRLLPSPYLTAVSVNLEYLRRLDPDRLLHNFRSQAGLPPKGAMYAGWESDTIGGHTLGHYLSALSLMYAQTGDAGCKRRVIYIVDELTLCQAQNADGFVAGFTRRQGDAIEPGRFVFDEIRRGDIRARSFDLNGSWAPLYSWHKLMAGLLDAHRHCGNEAAVRVAEKLGAFIGGVFDALNDEQIQKMLGCEHGGLNESFAELYSRSGNRRWLALSETIYQRKVLEPLSRGEDCLPNIHANTQIPKLIGLARLHELTGEARHLKAAGFFWDTVTRDYSYVIGGNADREYFAGPRSISRHITEQTCESCNSYNMLKLTRYLYAQQPRASYFDYYERTHLNHILAQHHPQTGMFAYMVPMMSGSHREFSTPFDDFWCCVGTGMESHAKHGDSIFWTRGNDVIVNLYIPATLNLSHPDIGLRLETAYPLADEIVLKVTRAQGKGASAISLRIPAWCETPGVSIDGQLAAARVVDGYLSLHRRWRTGQVIRLTLTRKLRIEPTLDDPRTVALLFGPMVLAGDLGPATQRWNGLAPVLVGDDLARGDDLSRSEALARCIVPTAEAAVFSTEGLVHPTDLKLRPFTFQHDNNTAVYFRRFTETEWQEEQIKLEVEQTRLRLLDARSTDVVRLGEADAERDHSLQSKISYAVVYRGRAGRDARSGGFFECTMKARPGPLTLQATYWGEERDRRFKILIDGTIVTSEQLSGAGSGDFVERDYSIPLALTDEKAVLRIRFEPEAGFSAGPVFGLRLFAGAAIPPTPPA
ncbi:MAG TPA: glycoside hydrolase family 127 protein [Steroidobacteraceae bacterium]|nr:glycoside hydrolase family 127 protein [Steroidobacteraceae bacterium]